MKLTIELTDDEVKSINEALTCLSNRFYWLALEQLDQECKKQYKQKELKLCDIRQKLSEARFEAELSEGNE